MFFVAMIVRAVVEVGKFLDVGCERDASGRKTFRLMLNARCEQTENVWVDVGCAMRADGKRLGLCWMRNASGRKMFRLMLNARWGRTENLY